MDVTGGFGSPTREHVLHVTGVAQGGQADKLGVKIGDLVKEVNGIPIEDILSEREHIDGPPVVSLVLKAAYGP
jgi:S1-C subfamily serine protease